MFYNTANHENCGEGMHIQINSFYALSSGTLRFP